jgi:aspartate racemase
MIGLVGGMSWRSTALYYRLINEIGEDAGGAHANPPMLLASLRYADLLEAARRDDWRSVENAIASGIGQIEHGGASFALMTAVTPHRLFDALAGRTNLPLLHVLDPAMAALKQGGAGRVGVLGTGFTLGAQFLMDRFERAGIMLIRPDPTEIAGLDTVIQVDLTKGLASPDAQDRARRIGRRLLTDGADALLLACTELPLLDWTGLPVFDAVRLHAEAAVSRCQGLA